MIFERLRILNPNHSTNHMLVLYGPGVNDAYLNQDGEEINFELALWQLLKEKGFDRITYCSPHQPLYCLDQKSSALSYLPDVSIDDINNSGQMVYLDDGPLHKIDLLKNHQNNMCTMGDSHLLRQIDSLISDENQLKSAVIFMQAESIIQWIDDRRLLSGLLGKFNQLPSTNKNLLILVFSSLHKGDFEKLNNQIYLPEIRKIFSHNQEYEDELFYVGFPGEDEIKNLININFKKIPTSGLEDEKGKICQNLVNEKKTLNSWIRLLSDSVEISMKAARKGKWFSSIQDNEFDIHTRINGLVGLEQIKQRLYDLEALIKLKKMNHKNGLWTGDFNLNFVFIGNPGTGKTTVARLIGELLYELGVLKRGQLLEVKAGNFISDHVGGTSNKVNQWIDKAIDGVLFIDEAYSLIGKDRGGYGQEAIETLMGRMEDPTHPFVTIIAGYPQKMTELLNANPGLQRRFPLDNRFIFDNFSVDQLFQIMEGQLISRNLSYDDSLSSQLYELIENVINHPLDNFGNAGEIKNIVDSIERNYAVRIQNNDLIENKPKLEWEDVPDRYKNEPNIKIMNLDNSLNRLNSLIGLENVKTNISQLINRIQLEVIRAGSERSYKIKLPTQNFLFSGNPGTGKTTVARILGEIFHDLGLLKIGHLVEVSRSDLVAGYVGQTALKTTECVKSALDGILFIDEAYSLSDSTKNDFGSEAINVLTKLMEDYKGRVVVIAAGYPDSMKKFISTNPGLASRFNNHIQFEDFSADELLKILIKEVDNEQFILSNDLASQLIQGLVTQKKKNIRQFGNARAVLSLFDEMKNRLSLRVMEEIRISPDILEKNYDFIRTFIQEDIPRISSELLQPPTQSNSFINNMDTISINNRHPLN